jgi:outer membrane biosynthesis protein TonB
VSVRIRAACPGREGEGVRQFQVSLPAQAPLAAISAPEASPPGVVARLNAGSGETLETMAAKVYPREGEARRRYLHGLRQLNPQYAASGTTVPEGTPLALPDPRTIRMPRAAPREATQLARTEPPAPAKPARRERPQRVRETPPPMEPAAPREAAPPPVAQATPPKLREPAPAKAREPAPAKVREAAAGKGDQAFVLKLSSAEVDLSRSRRIDDRMRAQLRERLLVLDADDQVAAMLSMRNSLKQLEARVAEMQLKLDSMPASLAARAAPAAAPKIEPPKVEPPKPEPPKVEAPKVAAAPKVEPPPPPRVEPPPPPKVEARVEAPPPKAEPPKVTAPPPKVEAPPPPKVVTPPAATKPTPRPSESFELPDWLWAVAAAFALLALFLAWRLWRRRRAVDEEDELPEPAKDAPAHESAAAAVAAASGVAGEEPIEVAFAEEPRPQVGSDQVLATRLPENAGELKRRYIEERFPEIQNGTIRLEDPASVIKAARLFYEDGALPRAVELLQFVIEEHPDEVRPWLALFEIFRLERLTGEFATLARRFRERHGKSPHWRKVQYFGREIDPGNALYREEPLNTLETIGPREAKRLAAGLASVGATDAFDPVAENWLEAPMDFENEVLANELRMKLMTQAQLTEQDLQPNPMPALRSIEMFTVA